MLVDFTQLGRPGELWVTPGLRKQMALWSVIAALACIAASFSDASEVRFHAHCPQWHDSMCQAMSDGPDCLEPRCTGQRMRSLSQTLYCSKQDQTVVSAESKDFTVVSAAPKVASHGGA